MAEKDEKKKSAEGGTPPPGAKPKKKKLLLFAGIGLAGIAAVALAVFFVFNPSKSGASKDNTAAQAKEAGHGAGKEGGHAGKEGEKGGSPLTFALEPFILNLADIDSNRYLKISITLEFDSPGTTRQAEQRVPQIRDALILLMTSLTYGDIHSVAGKLTLQSEIQNRISKVMEPGNVKRVYFTDLVVQ
ncbi:MAG: flagellar basal body-associated FliL family protein [Deltaproteobacteria bacterium]